MDIENTKDLERYAFKLAPDFSLFSYVEKEYYQKKLDNSGDHWQWFKIGTTKPNEWEDLGAYRTMIATDVALTFNDDKIVVGPMAYADRLVYIVIADEDKHNHTTIKITSSVEGNFTGVFF